jgi:hypothetical protein
MSVPADDERAKRLLDWIEEKVDFALNPEGEDCSECHGEGGTYDCIDGYCADAEDGCPDCFTPCLGCRIYERNRRRAILKEVVELGDIDVGIAWLKSVGRWPHGITRRQVADELARERAGRAVGGRGGEGSEK